MAFPAPDHRQIAFFAEHGWLVVEDAVPPEVLDEIERRCSRIHEDKATLARDWAWDESENLENRSFRIIQASPSHLWPDFGGQPYQQWLVDFASGLMGQTVEFWYDQYLAKPPQKSVPTYWHQDEGYWGRNLDDRGITCWLPLHDVSAEQGCMHFIDHGHKEGVHEHRRVEGMRSDLLTCDVEESRVIACPLRKGSVTFHHSKMPHMTTANRGPGWRKAVSNHMQVAGAGGEGGHYSWKVYVDQHTGETIIPERA